MVIKTQAHCIHCFTCANDGLVECEHCGADLSDVLENMAHEKAKRKTGRISKKEEKQTRHIQDLPKDVGELKKMLALSNTIDPTQKTRIQEHIPSPKKEIINIPLKGKDSSGAFAFGVIFFIPACLYPPLFFLYFALILSLHIVHKNRTQATLTVTKTPGEQHVHIVHTLPRLGGKPWIQEISGLRSSFKIDPPNRWYILISNDTQKRVQIQGFENMDEIYRKLKLSV